MHSVHENLVTSLWACDKVEHRGGIHGKRMHNGVHGDVGEEKRMGQGTDRH